MKKTKQELDTLASLVKRAYNRRGRKLVERLDKPYNIDNPELGYSWKFEDPKSSGIIYTVVAAKLPAGHEETEFKVKIHEYGHIYLAHFEGIYEELDQNICSVFKHYKGQIVDTINKNCGIDYGEKLVERVIDDPVLNHSLHNIAMDMEVNTKCLSTEDVEEMEASLGQVNKDLVKAKLEEYKKTITNPEDLKKIEDELGKIDKEGKIKLILPCRYHTPDGQPFPDCLSYPEYLLMIIKNLDQFVKMLVSISRGGNGDTSGITSEDIQNAGAGTLQGLGDLMEALGMGQPNGKGQGQGQGQGQPGGQGQGGASDQLGDNDTSNSGGLKGTSDGSLLKNKGVRDKNFMELDGGTHKDHCTNSRTQADIKRELGEIKAGGGVGCGDSGGAVGLRQVSKTDLVDAAIEEAVLEQKNRVIQIKTKRDLMKNWNLGRNRTVICPSISQKIKIDVDPKIVYLIDISGSMDTCLIDRILNTIAKKMRRINKGLRYDIITWSTYLGEHIKDIDPKKGVPRISTGGGTSMGEGIRYFKEHYDENAILIVASDFEDYLEEWVQVLKTMKNYSVWGFNYGRSNYADIQWPKNFKLRNFNKFYGE